MKSAESHGIRSQHPTLPLPGNHHAVRRNRQSEGSGIASTAGLEKPIPVILLDTDFPDNAAQDRSLTHWLYGGDQRYRLAQEAILGIGGVRILAALGYSRIEKFHMNEGHGSLLLLELLRSVQSCRSWRIFSTPVELSTDPFIKHGDWMVGI